jgi:hypothetical protein
LKKNTKSLQELSEVHLGSFQMFLDLHMFGVAPFMFRNAALAPMTSFGKRRQEHQSINGIFQKYAMWSLCRTDMQLDITWRPRPYEKKYQLSMAVTNLR